MVEKLTTENEYEAAFYGACNATFGKGGITETPKGVIAIFESMKSHVEQVFEAGTALQQATDSGNESAKYILSEHFRAQNVSHFRSKEDTHEFYVKVLDQPQGYEEIFLQQALNLEHRRVLHDQNSRLLLALNKLPCSSTFHASLANSGNSDNVATVTSKKFTGTKEHEDCKNAIREMVIRNPVEFMYVKSENYLHVFVSHELCPIYGSSEAEKVSNFVSKMCGNITKFNNIRVSDQAS